MKPIVYVSFRKYKTRHNMLRNIYLMESVCLCFAYEIQLSSWVLQISEGPVSFMVCTRHTIQIRHNLFHICGREVSFMLCAHNTTRFMVMSQAYTSVSHAVSATCARCNTRHMCYTSVIESYRLCNKRLRILYHAGCYNTFKVCYIYLPEHCS